LPLPHVGLRGPQPGSRVRGFRAAGIPRGRSIAREFDSCRLPEMRAFADGRAWNMRGGEGTEDFVELVMADGEA
jgi:hypothetical protein